MATCTACGRTMEGTAAICHECSGRGNAGGTAPVAMADASPSHPRAARRGGPVRGERLSLKYGNKIHSSNINQGSNALLFLTIVNLLYSLLSGIRIAQFQLLFMGLVLSAIYFGLWLCAKKR